MIRTLFKDIIDAVIKWWKQVWFEAKLKARLDMIELENRIESELEREIEQNRSTRKSRLTLSFRLVSLKSLAVKCV
jgi:hypothetical protein